MAWDIERDLELESYEVEGAATSYVVGSKSPLGYVVTSRNEVVSLDRGTVVTLFNLPDCVPTLPVRFTMNSSEEFFVLGSRVHMRYNLAQIIYAHGLKQGEEEVNEIDKCCY